jgi:hypothetical protein
MMVLTRCLMLVLVLMTTSETIVAEENIKQPKFITTEELFAEENKEYQKQLQQKAKDFKKSLSKGKAGRFQAIEILGGGGVFILDTKEGHMWLWMQSTTYYEGFVYPGVKVGDVVNIEPIKPPPEGFILDN